MRIPVTEPSAPDAADHFFLAEYWLNALKDLHGRRLRKYRNECIARAQVHATLALAAATMQYGQLANREAS
jgi:hypothetical protein